MHKKRQCFQLARYYSLTRIACQVFVLHGASKSSAAATAQVLKQTASQGVRVVVLLDPDVAGRQSRTVVDACLSGQCLHAFIPVHQATAASDIRYTY